MHKLRDLKVYQKSLAFTKLVRKTTNGFPKQELFGLTSQFTRAADSIVLNIAEGSGNSSNKEFARFLDYAVRSGFECLGCADIALDNGFINQAEYKNLVEGSNEIIAMLDGLRKRFIK
jgi:four helix bundle protein